jgi:hypothetical protein
MNTDTEHPNPDTEVDGTERTPLDEHLDAVRLARAWTDTSNTGLRPGDDDPLTLARRLRGYRTFH